MQLEFRDNYIDSSLQDIFIRKDNKLLKIFYGGNGDLYFDIFGEKNLNKNENGFRVSTFNISKEDVIYPYFDCLLDDITNCHVYYSDDGELDEISERLNRKLKEQNANSKLVHNGMVQLFSESTYDEKANSLKIKREGTNISLEFLDNDSDPTFGFGIRISNDGSRITPFNICFMNQFNQLQNTYKQEQKIKRLI